MDKYAYNGSLLTFANLRHRDIIVILISFSLLSLHFAAGLAGTLFPILKMRLSHFKILVPIILLLVFKIISSMVLSPGQYESYKFDYIFLIRETVTLMLFYTWLMIGVHLYNFSFFRSLNWKSVTIIILSVPLVQVFSFGTPVMAGITAAQAVFFFIIFVVFFERVHSIHLKLFTLCILLSTSFWLQSSFTTICALTLLLVFLISSTFVSRIMVPWRVTVVVAIAFLSYASTFAHQVNLKDDASSNGNNGGARETLAGYAFSIFSDFPILGTPMGRGIIPAGVIEELGWVQYLDADVGEVMAEEYRVQGFDAYALSFHNGFLYLLTRFGIFSILLFYLIIREVPRRAPLPLVLFSVVMLLSISANVVIESIRVGPGVALVLGALFSFQRKQLATKSIRGLADAMR